MGLALVQVSEMFQYMELHVYGELIEVDHFHHTGYLQQSVSMVTEDI